MLKVTKLLTLPILVTSILNFQALAENKMKDNITSIKSNMYTLQTIVETHGVDWKGLYPDNIENLKMESEKTLNWSYWKSFKNPNTENIGIGKDGSLINYVFYKSYKGDLSDLKGMVIYQSLECNNNKELQKNLCKTYRIFGTDEKGSIINIKGQEFYLTNG